MLDWFKHAHNPTRRHVFHVLEQRNRPPLKKVRALCGAEVRAGHMVAARDVKRCERCLAALEFHDLHCEGDT